MAGRSINFVTASSVPRNISIRRWQSESRPVGSVIYSFAGTGDGGFPVAGLVPGADGEFLRHGLNGGNPRRLGNDIENHSGRALLVLFDSFTDVADGGFPYA